MGLANVELNKCVYPDAWEHGSACTHTLGSATGIGVPAQEWVTHKHTNTDTMEWVTHTHTCTGNYETAGVWGRKRLKLLVPSVLQNDGPFFSRSAQLHDIFVVYV